MQDEELKIQEPDNSKELIKMIIENTKTSTEAEIEKLSDPNYVIQMENVVKYIAKKRNLTPERFNQIIDEAMNDAKDRI